MFTIANYSYENCAKKCKNPEHGEKINSALTNTTVSDEKLAAFIAKTCRSFAHIRDHQVNRILSIFFSFLQMFFFYKKMIS